MALQSRMNLRHLYGLLRASSIVLPAFPVFNFSLINTCMYRVPPSVFWSSSWSTSLTSAIRGSWIFCVIYHCNKQFVSRLCISISLHSCRLGLCVRLLLTFKEFRHSVSVFRQVHKFFHSQFSTECYPVFSLSISSIITFPKFLK